MEHKLANIQNAIGFLSTRVLRDQSKWRANENKDGEGHSAHLNFRSKSNEYWKENFDPLWNHWSHARTNWVGDHAGKQRIKIVSSS